MGHVQPGHPPLLPDDGGIGIHTFRLVNEVGETTLVKFHWKPAAGIHGLVSEEAQKRCGIDPDFHRRDLAEAIEAGAFPEWELGLQLLPDSDDQVFEGIDLLDPTKIVPEELAPVQLVGKLTLNRNPSNFFAETEQVAFHPGHLVRGIDLTDDPLLQGRLFSYLDTQLTRLGGPNFSQLPINRPHAAVNDNHRNVIGTRHTGHDARGTTTSRPAAAYSSTLRGQGHTMATGDNHLGEPLPRASNSGGEGPLRDREPLHRVATLTAAP